MENLKTTFIGDKKILYSDNVYQPREDSFLLAYSIDKKDVEGKMCLDVGCGSGIQAVNLGLLGARGVLAVDLNENALEITKKNAEELSLKIETRRSDLFESVKESFSVVVFNPPYLPSDKIEEIA